MRYIPLLGAPEPRTLLDMDGFAFPVDPQIAHGFSFETVTYASDIGDMTAWYLPGSTNSWVVFVHGKGAPLREVLRILPPLAGAGYHVLAINYRNDIDMPQDPSGGSGYGKTRDVEGAVAYAKRHGAADIALIGYSMGGGIAISFMLNSTAAAAAADVGALVLDSPMLDFSATVDLGASNMSLPVVGLPVPQSLTNVAKVIAGWRFGIDWDAIDYSDEIHRLDTPVLLIHGAENERVPIETREQFAAERADIVRFERFAEAGHVLSWNVDVARYQSLLTDFLSQHLT